MIDYRRTNNSAEMIKWLVVGLAIILIFMLVIDRAAAQHNHDAGHNDYSNWASQKTPACCNSQDCGELNEDEWRDTPAGTQIKIEGQWCPVEKQHYIIKGKSPDWNKAHACVGNSSYWQDRPPCERLLCFSGPGGV